MVRVPVGTRLASSNVLALPLDLPTWAAGTYDVVLRKGDAVETLRQPSASRPAAWSRLETNLVVPSAVGFNIPIRQTIWVEYRNTGDVAMPAPLLKVYGGPRGEADAGRGRRAASLAPPARGTSDSVEISWDSERAKRRGYSSQ